MVDYADEHFKDRPTPLRLRRRRLFALRAPHGRRRFRRVGLAAITFVLTICLFIGLGCGLLSLRLSRGPIAVSLEAQVAKALSNRVKHGFVFEVGGTDVATVNGRPALTVRQLQVKDEAGRSVIRAPEATIAVDPLKLLSGVLEPTRLDMHDVTLKLSILPDGDVALSAGSDVTLPFRLSDAFESSAPGPARPNAEARAPAASASSVDPPGDAVTRFARTLAPLIDTFTGADDALGGFDRLGIVRGILVLDDRSHNTVKTFRNLDFEFDRVGDGASRMTLAADGAEGRWSASLRGARHPDGSRTAAIDVADLTLDDVRSVPVFREPGFDSDLQVSTSLDLTFDALNGLTAAQGRMSTGSGFFRLNDPDHEPVNVDRIETAFRFDPASQRIVVEPSSIAIETTTYNFQGEIAPPRALADPWTINAGGSGTFGAERPGEKPVDLQHIDLAATYSHADRHLAIQRLSLAGPQVDLSLSADVRSDDSGLKLRTDVKAGRMPAPVILRLWPNLISAKVRAWLLANLQGGMVERGSITATLDDADLDKIKAQKSVADSHLRLDYVVSDVTLGFMNGVPPLHGLNGSGIVTGDTSKFTVNRGSMDVAPGRQLVLADGSLAVPSTEPKPTPAVITAHVVGPIDVLAELLGRDALKSYAALPPEAANVKGQIDGLLTVGLNLGTKTRAEDLKVAANAKMSGVVIEKVVGKQSLTNGTVVMALDKTGVTVKGDASLFGAPTTIDLKKPAGTAPGSANFQLTLDDAARAKAGLNLGRSVTGPVVAKVNATLDGSNHKASVDIDLTRASITGLVPGLAKPAGRPGRLTLLATQREDGVSLDNIVCDAGTFSARGSADLDGDGNFQSARLSQIRLSPGDDMKAEATQSGDGLKLVIRATNLDSRPFLKSLNSSDGPDGAGKDIDLDLHANVLTGQNSQALTAVDLRLLRRGGQTRKVQVNGRFGRAPVSVTSAPQGNVLTVNVVSADAGASLAFLDLYKRVSGGKLETTIRMMDGRMDGSATIHDFGLREDPAMKRLTEETVAQGKSGNTQIDASNLSFQKLVMSFSKTGTKVEVKDGAIFSPQMGATVQGTIDFARDRVALSGTFVPIYGVNNLFAQLPLVGPILGGGAHEGLFGINYKINGSVGTPALTVDPLSALAPGFLRKIFGAISEAAQDEGAPVPKSTAPTPDPAAR